VKISGGRFSLGKTGARSKPLVLEQVDVTVRDFASGSTFPFTFSAKVTGGGQVKLEGKAGPIHQADAVMTPWSATLSVARLDLAASGVAGISPVSGLVTLDGTGESNGATVNLKGKLQAEKLKLAKDGRPANRTVQVDFAVAHDLRKHSGVLSRGDIRIGGAPASLTGSYAERSDSTVLNLNLAGPHMPVPELAEMLPALGVVLPAGSSLQGGNASAKLAMEGPADKLVTSGTVALDNTRLAGFDLGKKMSVIETLAGIKGGPDTDIRTFSANVRVAPDGTSADDVRLDVPSIGELTGAGTVSPANALDFKMRATVHTSGALSAIASTAIPFVIQGSASQPVFRPDVKSLAKEQVKGAAGKAASGLLKGLFGGKK
jgi:AsmA protein